MKFTFSWLKDFLDTKKNLSELEDALNKIGLEVEGIEDPAEKLGDFTAAYIEKTEPHPNADRLKICHVKTKGHILQIVCGAKNARAGIFVCLSVPGMYIPGLDIILKKGKIRDIESQGMLCSLGELGLDAPEGDDGIMEFPDTVQVGDRVIDILQMNDPVIDISITPNRPDALGVYGIARDLAAFGFGVLKPLDIPQITGEFTSPITMTLNDPKSCPHFEGFYIKDVHNKPSPDWLKQRLQAIGCNTHSALVDITNYICYSFARPLHVFDGDKIGNKLSIGLAKDSETIMSLSEEEYTLKDTDIIVRDENKALAIAGIKGGLDSGCFEMTKNIFLESAYFSPSYIAQTGRRLQILSDARYRFERGIDPAFTQKGAQMALKMILDICGGTPSYPVSAGQAPIPEISFILHPKDVEKYTMLDIDWEKQQEILFSLGFKMIDSDEGMYCIPPAYRPDIKGSVDLIEEIIRIYGIDHIPSKMLPPLEKADDYFPADQKRLEQLRDGAVLRGLNEVISYSFTSNQQANLFKQDKDKKNLCLLNPIAAQLSDMRPNLFAGLLMAASKNMAYGHKDLSMFEIGRIYQGYEEALQPHHLSLIRTGNKAGQYWDEAQNIWDIFDIKADILSLLQTAGAPVSGLLIRDNVPDYYHPYRSGALALGRNIYAYFGQIHPKILEAFDIDEPVMAAEIMIDDIPLVTKKKKTTRPPYKRNELQGLYRDFAFIFDADIKANAILSLVRKADKKLINDVVIFDIYQGEHIEAGKKSVAFRVHIQPFNQTLTDMEIEHLSDQILQQVKAKLGGILR